MQDPQPIEPISITRQEQSDRKNTTVGPAIYAPQWLLLCEWVAYFLTSQIPSVASKGIGNKNDQGGSTWRCATPDDTVGVEFNELPATKSASISSWGITEDSHNKLLAHADRYARLKSTRKVIWHATFSSKAYDPFVPSTALHSLRGMDHARRVDGRVAFGSRVVLDFPQIESAKPTSVHFSDVNAKAYFAIDGAYHGPYTERVAKTWIPNVRACVSFCLGTVVHIGKFRPLGRSEEQELLASLSSNPVERQLAVEDLPLGAVLQHMEKVGSSEACVRLFRAIASFETAMQQGNEAATTIHLVTAIEALARPNYKKAWHNRVTQRYHEFLEECAPGKLDEIVAHPNLQTAFPGVGSRKELVAALYRTRSSAVHNGHAGEFHEHFGGDEAIRIMLISDVVRAAIIEFGKRPFSSLVGHPSVDSSISLKIDNTAVALLRERAIQQSLTVEQYISLLAHAPI